MQDYMKVISNSCFKNSARWVRHFILKKCMKNSQGKFLHIKNMVKYELVFILDPDTNLNNIY